MNDLANRILTKQTEMPVGQSLLAGISGIDASGKGYVAAKLAAELWQKGVNVANINVDGWLNLPPIRFARDNPGVNFYENAIRFDEMFARLVLPLKENRSLILTADLAEETAARFRKHEYRYNDIDVILLEGIFLFKNAFKHYFDFKILIECPFETALERAIARAQEGLRAEETVRAYETIYFPAQKIHLATDAPRESADSILENP